MIRRALVCAISIRLTLTLCSSHILTHSETSVILTVALLSLQKRDSSKIWLCVVRLMPQCRQVFCM